MQNCCFLSMDSVEEFKVDDHLTFSPLKKLGWKVETVSWHSTNTDWNRFDAVVIRTTWDYHYTPDVFLQTLRQIDASSARLENPVEIVEWNLNKLYLKDMAERGFRIVPTIWQDNLPTSEMFEKWQAELDSEELILKPNVSATARDTFRLRQFDAALENAFSNGRGYMVQPFLTTIIDEGEYSLFYFNGVYSHAVIKTPKSGDFRVQEDHGGVIKAIEPEAELRKAADEIAASIDPTPLYSRVDLVKDTDGNFCLMELELIEPSLYFSTSPKAANNFAENFVRRMNEL